MKWGWILHDLIHKGLERFDTVSKAFARSRKAVLRVSECLLACAMTERAKKMFSAQPAAGMNPRCLGLSCMDCCNLEVSILV